MKPIHVSCRPGIQTPRASSRRMSGDRKSHEQRAARIHPPEKKARRTHQSGIGNPGVVSTLVCRGDDARLRSITEVVCVSPFLFWTTRVVGLESCLSASSDGTFAKRRVFRPLIARRIERTQGGWRRRSRDR
ncbi:hypothetical protein FOVG_16573 [Fusarium oxysporum f. sp. pisi HDV247]|uniref:Uncharacterized protein n=1 Tax=Fusarium oxysporum f. sp. pisi HDV247 TaxID=1080344 RepID=W9NQE0_FUSOX|nr:hypothetical protein FOVG_16573 [Fusarium oxysporum f. sp. pisi HDV247]